MGAEQGQELWRYSCSRVHAQADTCAAMCMHVTHTMSRAHRRSHVHVAMRALLVQFHRGAAGDVQVLCGAAVDAQLAVRKGRGVAQLRLVHYIVHCIVQFAKAEEEPNYA